MLPYNIDSLLEMFFNFIPNVAADVMSGIKVFGYSDDGTTTNRKSW